MCLHLPSSRAPSPVCRTRAVTRSGGSRMRHFVIGTAATAIAFAIVAYLLPQIDFSGSVPQLILLAVVFGVVNGFIKPVVKLFSFPITAMTLGLFGVVINAALFLLVAWVAGDIF